MFTLALHPKWFAVMSDTFIFALATRILLPGNQPLLTNQTMRKFQADFCVAKTDRLLNESAGFVGHNGQTVFVDASFNPEHHVNNQVVLASVPNKLTKKPLGFNAIGAPHYYEFSPTEVYWLDQLPMVLRQGDTAYLKYTAIVNAIRDRRVEEVVEDGKKWYYFPVSYEDVFCVKRDGEYICNATWTLVEPDMESWDDILLPLPMVGADGKMVIDALGVPVLKPKEQWLSTKSKPGNKPLRGFVRAIGEPQKGEICDLSVGDHIIYHTNADFEVTVDNQKYFLMKQRHILAVIEN
jgi:hypothetical protein